MIVSLWSDSGSQLLRSAICSIGTDVWCPIRFGFRIYKITFYSTDVIRIAHPFGVRVLCYAGDLQLYEHCRANKSAAAVAHLIACIAAIETWMGFNGLKINRKKTQFIWLCSPNWLAAIHFAPFHLYDGTVIAPLTNVHNSR